MPLCLRLKISLKYYIEGSNFENCKYVPHDISIQKNTSPVHLVQDLESLRLSLSLYFFFKNAENITSGGLILYLEKIGILQKIFI